MGVESKIRELMEAAGNRPLDKSQGDATNPTQGSSNPNPEQQDLSGSSNKEGGLTSEVGKAASAKVSKDTTLPSGNGAKEAPSNFENEDDPTKVVNQSTSAGVREEAEESEVEEVIAESDAEEVAEEEVIAEDEEVAVEEALYEEELQALFADDENLTEEFKTKAAEIFEAVVTSRVAAEVEQIEADLIEEANNVFDNELEVMVENIDKYMSYCVENWLKENELAIESGLRNEITESFIKGLQQVFTEHYIDVPEEKFDVLEDLQSKVDDLQSKLDEQIEKNIAISEEAINLKKQKIASQIAEGLADTEVEKFVTLVEDITYTNSESYAAKLQVVKDNYFRSEIAEDTSDKLEDTVEAADLTENTIMNRYASALSKSAKF